MNSAPFRTTRITLTEVEQEAGDGSLDSCMIMAKGADGGLETQTYPRGI